VGKINDELTNSVALTRVPMVGNTLAKYLINFCGSATEVFKTPKSKLIKIPEIGEKIADNIKSFKEYKSLEHEFSYIEKNNVQVYFYTDAHYPIRLKQIPDPPIVLFGMGTTNLNVPKVISVVGTRNATVYGKEWTEKFIHELSNTGCLVVSGLASGIDTFAHRSSLKANLKTVGVLGSGLKNIYPAQNKVLAKQIIEEGGSILTEYLSDIIPDKTHFPERNRIVAGMCDAIVVVETKKKGGSMITAGLAFQYDRDVFALPGKITDENAEGCHYLIKTNKAALIENASDLQYQMRWDIQTQKPVQQQLFVALTPDERRIFDLLKTKGKTGIDDICFELNLAQHQASMNLLEMEMKDVIRSLPGKYFEIK
jgi:DNA processing protein